jgi:2-dehydro-3-deoxyphosphogluconate aldolase/(4S)-4-hydroxy-2-oxoglutarate aldolase
MDPLDVLEAGRIVPVVEIEDPRTAVPLARALAAGGIATMEVTLRTSAALDAIRAVVSEVEGFLVGAGTLVMPEQIGQVVAAGAAYGVAPGWHPSLSATAADAGLPFVPGVVTPSEALDAAAHGHRRLKFFPAGSFGGVATLRALASPLAALEVAFMPTGGVRIDDLAAYLELPNVFAVGGTWIAPRAAIRERDTAAITREAAAVVAIAQQ